jgi:uncharacterized protein (UPF0548 family)
MIVAPAGVVTSPAAVFLFSRPDRRQLDRFLATQRNQTFSYREVGASRRSAPAGYQVDHNRVQIGEGRAAFARSVEALRSWKQFDLGWVSAYPTTAPLESGVTVTVRVQHYGFWSLNAARIVYTIEDEGPVVRFGFAYGTLSDHAEMGEERFSVEWHHEDGSVWYDLFAFSRPNHALVAFARPLGRRLQKRFARDSMRAMAKAAAAQWPGAGETRRAR